MNFKKLLILLLCFSFSNIIWSQIVTVDQTFVYSNSGSKTYTVADLPINGLPLGHTPIWMNAPIGGTAFSLTDALVSGAQYYLQNTEGYDIGKRLRTTTFEVSASLVADKPNNLCDGEAVTINANGLLTLEEFIATNTHGNGLDLVEIGTFQESAYFIHLTPTSWSNADDFISAIPGASMYIVNNQAEERFVWNALGGVGGTNTIDYTNNGGSHSSGFAFWLGLAQFHTAFNYYDGYSPTTGGDINSGWYWVDGTPIGWEDGVFTNFHHWDTRASDGFLIEPNDYGAGGTVGLPGGDEDYALFDFQSRIDGVWVDAPDDSTLHHSLPVFEFSGTNSLQWSKLNTVTGLYEPLPGETNGVLNVIAEVGTQEFRLDFTIDGESQFLTYSVIGEALPEAPTGDSAQSFCENSTPTIADLVVTGENIQWYASETDTTPLDPTTPLANGTVYWASASSTLGCESTDRLQVSVTLSAIPQAPTGNGAPSFCVETTPTLADLIVTGENIQWYASETDTTPLDTTTPLADATVYWASSSSDDGCENPNRLQVSVSLSVFPDVPTGDSLQNFCEVLSPTIADLVVNGENIQWFASNSDTTPLDITTPLSDGNDYWASSSTNSGCENPSRLQVSVEISALPQTPTGDSIQSFCIYDNPTLEDIVTNTPAGTSLIWYDSESSNSTISETTQLTIGEDYWAAAINDVTGCISANRLSVTFNSECPELKIFTGFSPNNDGVNDTYSTTVLAQQYPDFEIQIFNRWGRRVFKGNANTLEWNGEENNNGKLVPVGVYYYVIQFNKDGEEPKQGEIYVSR